MKMLLLVKDGKLFPAGIIEKEEYNYKTDIWYFKTWAKKYMIPGSMIKETHIDPSGSYVKLILSQNACK